MKVWDIANPAANLNTTQSSYSGKSNSVASEYSKILAEKMSNIRTDIQKMDALQDQLDEIADLQEELTGEVKVDEDSGNADRDDSSGVSINDSTETIKRFMPDGSIMITTYEGAKIVEQIRQRPHMIAVPDFSAPPKDDGSPATKLEARQSLDLASLLMM